jgi:hypothetical protein
MTITNHLNGLYIKSFLETNIKDRLTTHSTIKQTIKVI